MRRVAHLHPGLSVPTLLGEQLLTLAEALLARSALPDRSGIIVLDARVPGVLPSSLSKLLRLPDGGALLAPDDRVLAAWHPDEAMSPAALLAEPHAETIHVSADEALFADDLWEAAKLERRLVDQHLRRLAADGVRLIDPDRIWIEPRVQVAAGATLWGGAVLRGTTSVAAGAEVQPGCWLEDTVVGEGALIRAHSVCEHAQIGPHVQIGPMAHLREGTVLEEGARVGNFVETKKARLGPGAKANHLTYLGDVDVGAKANIGAGTITCNYDGHGKHRTLIGAGAFIGSNSALVAPISIGEGAIVGAGATLTRDVPAGAIAVARGEQRVLENRAAGLHRKNAELAAAAKRGDST